MTERDHDAVDRPPYINLTTSYKGNRVVSRFFPEHYARVQLARQQAEEYTDICVVNS